MKPSAKFAWLAACVLLAAAAAPAGQGQDGGTRMQVIKLDQWREILADQQPHIVVVDLWASWCVSCIERFPKMVEMARRYQGRGVRFLTLDLDDPRDQAGIDWANDFLARIGAGSANYHLAENLMRSFEELNLMALPVVLVYDGQGRERYRLTNDDPNRQFTDADVEAAIRKLLADVADSPPSG